MDKTIDRLQLKIADKQIKHIKFYKLNFNLINILIKYLPFNQEINLIFTLSKQFKLLLMRNKFYKKLFYSTKKYRTKILYVNTNIKLISKEFEKEFLTNEEFIQAYCYLFNKINNNLFCLDITKHIEQDSFIYKLLKDNPERSSLQEINMNFLSEGIKANKTIKTLIIGDYIRNETKLENFLTLCEAIKINKSIKILDASNTILGLKPGFILGLSKALQENKSIKILILNSACFQSNTEFEIICKGIALNDGIESINLDNNPLHYDLNNMNSLINLLNRNSRITALSMKGIFQKNYECKLLELFPNYLKENTSIKDLNLSNNPFGKNSYNYKRICEALKINKTIQTINLSGNYLGIEDYMFLSSECLKENNSLKKINLSANNLGNKTNKNNLQFLSEAFAVNRSIEHLDISINNLNIKNIECLFPSLVLINKTLQVLNLSNNNLFINPEASKLLFPALAENNNIKKLILQKNYLGKNIETIELISDMLIKNKILNHLDLSINRIGEFKESLDLLAKAINMNKTLLKLNLSSNLFDEENLVAICNLFLNNKSIEDIDISRSKFYENEFNVKYLAKAIENNQTIRKIGMARNGICKNAYVFNIICEAFCKNKTLIQIDISKTGLTSSNHNIGIINNLLKQNKIIKSLIIEDKKINKNQRLKKILKDDRLCFLKGYNENTN